MIKIIPYYNETDGYYFGIRNDFEVAYSIDLLSNDGEYLTSGVYSYDRWFKMNNIAANLAGQQLLSIVIKAGVTKVIPAVALRTAVPVVGIITLIPTAISVVSFAKKKYDENRKLNWVI